MSHPCLAGLCALALQLGCGQSEPEWRLEPPARPPVTRQIAPGESFHYDLDLPAGHYLRLTLQEKGLELKASLADPGGKPLAEAGLSSRRTVKVLSLVTPATGRYRLTVAAAAGAAPPGVCVLTIWEERQATRTDGLRVAGQRAFAQGLAERQRAAQGASQRALARFAEARRLWQRAGDAEGEIEAQIQIGDVQSVAQEAEAALAGLEAAYSAAREARYAHGAALALSDLAGVQVGLGQASRAIESSRHAFRIWRRTGDLADAAAAASDIGFVYSQSPATRNQAERWLTLALDLRHQAGDVAGEADTFNALGLLYHGGWNLDQALAAYEKARDRSRQVGDHFAEITALGNLGAVHHHRGDLQEALDSYLAVLKDGGGDPEAQGRTYQNLGSLYVELGDFERARDSYQAALRVLPAGSTGYRASATNNLGSALRGLEGPQAALEQYERALELSSDAALETQHGLALHGIGKAYLDLGQPAEGLSSLRQALAIRRQKDDRVGMAKTLVEIGDADVSLGQLDAAATSYEEALALARQTRSRAIEATCRFGRAMLERQRGDLERAREEIENALRILEPVRNRFLRDQTRTSFFATLRDYYEVYITILMQQATREPGAHQDAEAFKVSERARARGLLDLLSDWRIHLPRGVSPELKKREADLDRKLYENEAHLSEARVAVHRDEALIDRLVQERSGIESQEDLLARDIGQQDPRYAEVREAASLDAPGIGRQLGSRQALLEYFLAKESSYLFVITPEGMRSYDLHRPGGDVERQVDDLRKLLQKPSLFQRSGLCRQAADLYQVLVAPAAELLQKRDLLIVPDGALHLLPFEVLLTTGEACGRPALAELPYLLREHTVSYVPSGSVLKGLRDARPAAAADRRALRFLGFAHPLTSTPPPPLSEVEVKGIASLYPSLAVQLYVDGDANRQNVLDNPLVRSARAIHFATHGLFDASHPELSGLALTPGKDGDDGVLRVDDVFNLKLDADLVVLSACETGVGKQVSGEGLVGLTRAFFYAGTPSLVVSLWQVADDPTPRLMLDFYRRLNDRVAKAEALRRSKLALIRSGTYSHPFYWAPFVLVGDSM